MEISDIHRRGKRTLPAKNAEGIGKRERTRTDLAGVRIWTAGCVHTLQVMREAPELIREIGTEKQLVGAISVGYPAEAPLSRPRKPIEDILEYRV